MQASNGVEVRDGHLIVGVNSDRRLRYIDLDDRTVTKYVRLGSGNIDGIRSDEDGNLLVSHYEGRLYCISPEGEVTKLLDTSVPEINIADFEYIPEKDLIIIPTFFDRRVTCYRLNHR